MLSFNNKYVSVKKDALFVCFGTKLIWSLWKVFTLCPSPSQKCCNITFFDTDAFSFLPTAQKTFAYFLLTSIVFYC